MTLFERHFIVFSVLFITLLIIASIPLLAKADSLPNTSPNAKNCPQCVVSTYIAQQAVKYGVDPKTALYITYKESYWDTNAKGDYKNGKPTSFGVWQIHNPKQKGMTRPEAEDLIISTKWAMEQLAKGKCKIWSTCPSPTTDSS